MRLSMAFATSLLFGPTLATLLTKDTMSLQNRPAALPETWTSSNKWLPSRAKLLTIIRVSISSGHNDRLGEYTTELAARFEASRKGYEQRGIESNANPPQCTGASLLEQFQIIRHELFNPEYSIEYGVRQLRRLSESMSKPLKMMGIEDSSGLWDDQRNLVQDYLELLRERKPANAQPPAVSNLDAKKPSLRAKESHFVVKVKIANSIADEILGFGLISEAEKFGRTLVSFTDSEAERLLGLTLNDLGLLGERPLDERSWPQQQLEALAKSVESRIDSLRFALGREGEPVIQLLRGAARNIKWMANPQAGSELYRMCTNYQIMNDSAVKRMEIGAYRRFLPIARIMLDMRIAAYIPNNNYEANPDVARVIFSKDSNWLSRLYGVSDQLNDKIT